MSTVDHVKFQTAFACFMRQECNADKPMTSHLLHVQKIKLYCPQAEDQLEPHEFLNLMVSMNGLIPWIDPIVAVNNQIPP